MKSFLGFISNVISPDATNKISSTSGSRLIQYYYPEFNSNKYSIDLNAIDIDDDITNCIDTIIQSYYYDPSLSTTTTDKSITETTIKTTNETTNEIPYHVIIHTLLHIPNLPCQYIQYIINKYNITLYDYLSLYTSTYLYSTIVLSLLIDKYKHSPIYIQLKKRVLHNNHNDIYSKLTDHDYKYINIMHTMAKRNHDAFFQLLMLCPTSSILELDIQYNYPPLIHSAIYNDDSRILQYLIDLNCDVNCRDNSYDTPLHVATKLCKYNHVKILMNTKSINIHATNRLDRTPLHYMYESCLTEYDFECKKHDVYTYIDNHITSIINNNHNTSSVKISCDTITHISSDMIKNLFTSCGNTNDDIRKMINSDSINSNDNDSKDHNMFNQPSNSIITTVDESHTTITDRKCHDNHAHDSDNIIDQESGNHNINDIDHSGGGNNSITTNSSIQEVNKSNNDRDYYTLQYLLQYIYMISGEIPPPYSIRQKCIRQDIINHKQSQYNITKLFFEYTLSTSSPSSSSSSPSSSLINFPILHLCVSRLSLDLYKLLIDSKMVSITSYNEVLQYACESQHSDILDYIVKMSMINNQLILPHDGKIVDVTKDDNNSNRTSNNTCNTGNNCTTNRLTSDPQDQQLDQLQSYQSVSQYNIHKSKNATNKRTNNNDSNTISHYLDNIRSSSNGSSLIHIASSSNKYNTTHILQYLINIKCDINVRDKSGYTPLYNACIKHKYNHAQLLLQSGATFNDVDYNDNDNNTNIMTRSNKNRSNKIDIKPSIAYYESAHPSLMYPLYIKYYADMNIYTVNDNTPLHCVVSKYPDIVLDLLSVSLVYPSIQDSSYKTPLDILAPNVIYQTFNTQRIYTIIQYGGIISSPDNLRYCCDRDKNNNATKGINLLYDSYGTMIEE